MGFWTIINFFGAGEPVLDDGMMHKCAETQRASSAGLPRMGLASPVRTCTRQVLTGTQP
eukprot:COSAG01_NODE_42928_length_435_cov_0.619048_2_plen_58_part_01